MFFKTVDLLNSLRTAVFSRFYVQLMKGDNERTFFLKFNLTALITEQFYFISSVCLESCDCCPGPSSCKEIYDKEG